MTGRDFDGIEPVDLGLPGDDVDLLADYLVGALHGTPAEADVAQRLRDEPAWDRASTELTRSIGEVSTRLADWGRIDEPMPADIAERISVALAQAPAPQRLPARPQPARQTPAQAAPLAARVTLLTRSRTWLARRAGPLAVAASVLAFCGFGMWMVPYLAGDQQNSTDSGAAAPATLDAGRLAGSPESAAGGVADMPVRNLIASGTDYRPETLSQDVHTMTSATEADGTGPKTRVDAKDNLTATPDRAPAALRRLTAPVALNECLAAIGREHAYPVAAIQLVDYASFESAPALMVVFVDSTGARRAWAAGPGCGLRGMGADIRYRAKVG